MTSTAEAFACPVEGCETAFAQKYNVGRHLQEQHGIKRDSAEYRRLMGLRPKNAAHSEHVSPKSSVLSQIDAEIATLTAPFKKQVRDISRRLDEIDMEAIELRAKRRQIEKLLKQIDPTSFVATPKKTNRVGPTHVGSDGTNEAKRQAVLAFLEAHRDQYENGILASVLCRDMKAAGVEPIMSPTKVLDFVRALHADGVLRADKKVRGGAMQYEFVANGASNAEA